MQPISVSSSVGDPFDAQVLQPIPASETQSTCSTRCELGDVKSIQLVEIPLDAITTQPQVRKTFDAAHISRLAEAIRQRGQLSSIVVGPSDSPGLWVVIVGEQRFRALKEAGKTTAWCLMLDGTISLKERIIRQVQENSLQQPLPPCQEAAAFETVRQLEGGTLTELAQEFGCTITHISRRLELLNYTAAQQAQIDAGEIGETVAGEIAKIENEKDRLKYFDRAVVEQWSKETAIAAVSALVTRRKSRIRSGRPLKRVTFRLGEQGATITVTAPDTLPELTSEEVMFAMERAFRDMKRVVREKVPAAEIPAFFNKTFKPKNGKPSAEPKASANDNSRSENPPASEADGGQQTG